MWCKDCDPKFFVVYGFCERCHRRCEPPLFDNNSNMSILDYEEMKETWNKERSDLILDAIRRTKKKHNNKKRKKQ